LIFILFYFILFTETITGAQDEALPMVKGSLPNRDGLFSEECQHIDGNIVTEGESNSKGLYRTELIYGYVNYHDFLDINKP